MNKKRKTIWSIIIFAAFIVIAYIVYASLSKKYEPNQENGIKNIIDISSLASEGSDVTSQLSGAESSLSSGLNNINSSISSGE